MAKGFFCALLDYLTYMYQKGSRDESWDGAETDSSDDGSCA